MMEEWRLVIGLACWTIAILIAAFVAHHNNTANQRKKHK